MNWENLTSKDFKKAVEDTKVCVIALGVVEKHGDHLPLGTDFLNGHKIATAAAKAEPAVVFPPFYFGQIYEAKCFPGTITLRPKLLLELLQEVLDEIGRNGFEKIVLLNAHGGNDAFLKFLAQCQLAEKKPYQVYMYQKSFTEEERENIKNATETTVLGHACEVETSISLYHHEELIQMDQIDAEPFLPKRRLQHMPPMFSGLSWYANYPEHYVGDASVATKERGRVFVEAEVASLARFIKAVKEDKVLHALADDFFSRGEKIAKK